MGQHHPRRQGIAAAALAMSLLAAPSCGASERDPQEPSQDLTGARAFETFPLYFAGRRQGDLALTVTEPNRDNPYRRGRPLTFGYGFCTPPEGGEGGCALPLQVQNFHASAEHLARYRGGMVRPARTLCIRGVRAGVFEHGGRFDKLLLTTGRTTVVIFAEDVERARAVVMALRSVDGEVRPRGPLPEPARRIRHRTGAPC